MSSQETGSGSMAKRLMHTLEHDANMTDLLPPELMADVFKFAVQEKPSGDDRPKASPVSLTLSTVCQRWRSLALATALVWQRIFINRNSSSQHHWAELCIQRCKGRPIDIDIYWDYSDLSASNMFDLLEEVLVPFIDQWRTVTISADGYDALYAFLVTLASEDCPLLEALELSNRRHGEPSAKETVSLKPELVPCLTNIKLRGTYIDWRPYSPSAVSTFSTFTHLELSCTCPTRIAYVVDALVASPHLEELIVRGAHLVFLDEYEQDIPTTVSSAVTLPSLQSLTLCEFSVLEDAAYIVALVHAPNLLHLTVANWREECYEEVLMSLPKSYPLVKELHIFNISSRQDEEAIPAYRSLLVGMPHIVHLEFESEWIPGDICQLLAWSQPSSAPDNQKPVLLPLLEILQLSGCPLTSVLHLAKERNLLGKPLKKVMLNKDDPLGTDDSLVLSKLSTEVHVQVEYFEETKWDD